MKKKLMYWMLIICMLSTMLVTMPISAAAEDVDSSATLFAGLPANISYVHCWYDSNVLTTQVNFNYLAQSGILYVAVYDNQKLVALQKKSVSVDETENIVEITGANANYQNYDVKIFYWSGSSLLKPLSTCVESDVTTPVPSEGYGFIVSATTAGYQTYQISLLNQEGNTILYNLADKVRYAPSYRNGIFAENADSTDVYADIMDLQTTSWIHTEATTANIDNYARRIVSYKTNEHGEIYELAFASASASGSEPTLTYSTFNIKEKAYYNNQTHLFNNLDDFNAVNGEINTQYYVDENTVLFNLPINARAQKSDFSVTTVDSLSNQTLFKAAFLPLGSSSAAKVMIVVDKTRISKTIIDNPSTIQPANTGQLMESVLVTDSDKVNYLSVFDEEVDSTATTYNLAKNAKLVVNNQFIGSIVHNSDAYMYTFDGMQCYELGLVYAPAKGTVTLLDTDFNNIFDYVFVDTYEVAIIEDIIDSTTSKKIYTTQSVVIDLTNHIQGKEGYAYSLTLNGEKATLADLQPNDVIAVSMSANRKMCYIKAARNTVSGVVTSVTLGPVLAEKKFTVNGTTYKVANLNDKSTSKLQNIRVGDEAMFYLDIYGDVALAKRVSLSGDNYAFIVGAGHEASAGDVTYQIRLLGKDGNIATYQLADKVRSNLDRAGDNLQSEDAEDVYDAILATNDGNYEWIIKSYYPTVADLSNYAGRIVTFKTNSDGKITEIVFGTAGAAGSPYLTNNGNYALDAKYNAKTYTFINNYFVDENTVVFNLPINGKATRDDFSVDTISTLTHEQNYAVAFLSVDENAVAKVIVVINNEHTVPQGSNLAVVKQITASVNADFECVYDITLLHNGELKTLQTTPEIYVDMGDILSVGDVFEYATDKNGCISMVALGPYRDYVASIEDVIDFSSAFDLYTNAKEQYVFGYVFNKNNRGVITIGDHRDAHALPADANYYMIDLTKARNNVSLSSYDELKALRLNPETDQLIPDSDHCVFMKYYNEEITDVVIYKGLVTKEVIDAYGIMYESDETEPETEPANYAFIVGAGEEESVGDTTYQVRLLDKDGNIATYPLAGKVRSNLNRAGDNLQPEDDVDVYAAILATNNYNDEWIIKSDYPTAADLANYAGRIVTFKTNSNAQITEIVFGTAGAAGSPYLTNNGNYDLDAKYNAKTYTFINNYAVDEDTVVFNLPINGKATRDDFSVDTISTLTHEQNYAVAFLSVDENAVAKVIVVVNNEATVAQGSNLAVATKVMSAQNENFDLIYNITFYHNGELKTLATTEDVYSDMGDVLRAGVVFEYATDKNGCISMVALGPYRDYVASIEDVIRYGSTFDPYITAKEQYVFGYVASKNSNRVITLGDDRDAHVLPADANYYMIDLTKTKNNIEISSYAGIRAIKVMDGEVLVDNDYCVFMKYYNDEITDVIIYKGAIGRGFVDITM